MKWGSPVWEEKIEKEDHPLINQWHKLLEIQEIQMELMEEHTLKKNKTLAYIKKQLNRYKIIKSDKYESESPPQHSFIDFYRSITNI